MAVSWHFEDLVRLPEPITEPAAQTQLNARRHDRLRGGLHEYEQAA